MSLSSFRKRFRLCDCSSSILNLNSWWDQASFKAKVPICLLCLFSMTRISCARSDTTEPWSALAMFSELFYQCRAGGFSEGREKHIAHHTPQLRLVHISVSVSVRELDIQSWPLVRSSGPLQFWLKTCCYCPTVLESDDGKKRLQIWPAFWEHHPSIWMPKPVGSHRRCNSENFHFPVTFLTLFVTNTLNLKLWHCYLFSYTFPYPQNTWDFSSSDSASPAPGDNA